MSEAPSGSGLPGSALPGYALDVDGARRFVRDALPTESLLEVLRGRLGVLAVKEGCADGGCGACTVLLDREPVNACLLPAITASGRGILTAAGIGGGGQTGVALALATTGAIQCGFCTPATVLVAEALLAVDPAPSEAATRDALSGIRCRCGGHGRAVAAVLAAARARGGRGE